MVAEQRLVLVADTPPFTGIGTYARSLFILLRPVIPDLELVSLHPSDAGRSSGGPLAGLRRTESAPALPFFKQANRAAFRKWIQNRNAVLHILGPSYSLTTAGLPSVCTVHDYYGRVPTMESLRSPRELAIDALVNLNNVQMIRYLSHAAGIVTVSYVAQTELKARLGLQSEVIHHWIDAERFHSRSRAECRRLLGLSETDLLLLNVGGHGANKNLGTLSKIASGLPEPWKLVKIGVPLVNSRCVNPGVIPPDRYPLYFNAADVYVHTSLKEGFGIPILEAMASGLPVLLPKCSTGPEIAGRAGIYVQDPRATDQYLAAVSQLKDSALRLEAGVRSQEQAKEFSADRALAAYLRIYQDKLGVAY